MNIKNTEYYNLISDRSGSRALKIPCNLSVKLCKDPKLLKAVALWLCMKPIFYNGEIRNVRGNMKEFAAALGIGSSALRYKLYTLEQKQLIRWDESGNLFLGSWKKLFSVFGIVRPGRFKFYYLKDEFSPYSIELIIRRYTLSETLKKQEHEIDQKIFRDEMKRDRQLPVLKALDQILKSQIPKESKERLGKKYIDQLDQLETHDFTTEKTLLKKVRKTGLFSTWYRQAEAAYYRNRHEFDFIHEINFHVSISCLTTAKLFQCQAKSSGYYWQRRLEKARLISIKSWAIPLDESVRNYPRMIFEQSRGAMELHHFIGKKGIWKRLKNTFQFTQISDL